MNVRYRVELSQAERDQLTALLSGGKHAARKLKRAQILLAADAGVSDDDIAASVAVGGSTVYRTKRRFVEGNLEAALSEEPRPGAARKLTGKEEALLVATACSNPPEGRARWTLELLAGEMVRLTEHEDLSRETVRRRLAENDLKPWQGHVVHSAGRRHLRRPHGGCARPLCRSTRSEAAGGLLRRKPDPADRRGAPADPGRARPAGTLRLRVPPQRHGQPVRLSRRAPSWRKVKVTDHRTAADFAHCMRELVDIHYPKAEQIRVVLDNLSTHTAGALYETFPAPEAHRVLHRLEFHYTPKHASWLNMVEIEIGVLRGQCLDRRIGERTALVTEITAWEAAAQRRRRPHQMDVHHRTRPRQTGPRLSRSPPKSHNHCAEVRCVHSVRDRHLSLLGRHHPHQ